MIQVSWQDQLLSVRRLVFRRGHTFTCDAALDRIAARFRLEVADERAAPRPGDFWVGCHPHAGWGGADPDHVGWASIVDVPLAVGALRRAAAALEPVANETVTNMPAHTVAFA